jgi:tetrahydromethanopterin S-methyltransferase subunit B
MDDDERKSNRERNLFYGMIVGSIIMVVLCAVAVYYMLGK